ncbi:hypothetical protein FB45DRAFT_920222 [Roridomyces roridus]|uniref:TLC domain-containing protein n=1 Tax=Roridomyces roridus TaxID=1738132 RepID=A0AAD7BPK1_9AGAR|nr:hypothetical protein FB45DRAFT_920222 [Roridomyces roridus]
MAMSSQSESITATTVAFYPVPAVLYFLFLYVSAKVAELLMAKICSGFSELSLDHRRNTVSYVLNIFWSTVALGLQLAASPILAERYTTERLDLVRLAALIISGLYIFELTYRPSLRMSILIHHFCTLFAVVLIVCVLQQTLHPALPALGLLWIFHASTEQGVFLGLIMYRLRLSQIQTQRVLYFSAVQTLLFKFTFSIYLFVWWGLKLAPNHEHPIDVVFSVLFVLTLTALMGTQGYGSWAAWSIARSMSRGPGPEVGLPDANQKKEEDSRVSGSPHSCACAPRAQRSPVILHKVASDPYLRYIDEQTPS